MKNLNFDAIRTNYEKEFEKSVVAKKTFLSPSFQDWFRTLNEVHYNVYLELLFDDSRFYPLYPVGSEFVDFGNPFKQVGIEIIYNNQVAKNKQSRLDYFKSMDWTVYLLEGKNDYLHLSDLYEQQKRKYKRAALEDLENEDWLNFMEHNKNTHPRCLSKFIQYKHLRLAVSSSSILLKY